MRPVCRKPLGIVFFDFFDFSIFRRFFPLPYGRVSECPPLHQAVGIIYGLSLGSIGGDRARCAEGTTRLLEWTPAMSGFRTPEISREQLVLWERRLEDAIPEDHQVRHAGFLPGWAAFSETFGEMGPEKHSPAIRRKRRAVD